MTKHAHHDKDQSAQQVDQAAQPSAEDLAKQVAELTKEHDGLLERLARVSADYLNYQKRVQRDMAESREYGTSNLIKQVLVVLDDMERAIAAADSLNPDDPLLTGMRLVQQKLMDVLGSHGLVRIRSEGEPFDADKHQAILMENSDQYAQPTVVRELQGGYELKGRVIRPAQVVVSQPAEAKAEGEPHQVDGQG